MNPDAEVDVVTTYPKKHDIAPAKWHEVQSASVQALKGRIPADPMTVSLGLESSVLPELQLISHVDALLYGFDDKCPEVRDSIEELKKIIKLTVPETPFTFCGKQVAQDGNFTIRISMPEAVRASAPAHVSKARREDPESELEPEEVRELRAGNGSLGWVARQLRADLAVAPDC